MLWKICPIATQWPMQVQKQNSLKSEHIIKPPLKQKNDKAEVKTMKNVNTCVDNIKTHKTTVLFNSV